MIVAAVSLLGTIPNWILIALAVFVSWRISRGGAGSAVSELSKANEVLEKRLQELRAEAQELRLTKAALETRTDFEGSLTRALDPVALALKAHESGAQERSKALISLIDERLPNRNGTGPSPLPCSHCGKHTNH